MVHFSPETLILNRVGNKSLWLHKRNETSVFSPNYRKVTHHHHYSSQRKTEGKRAWKIKCYSEIQQKTHGKGKLFSENLEGQKTALIKQYLVGDYLEPTGTHETQFPMLSFISHSNTVKIKFPFSIYQKRRKTHNFTIQQLSLFLHKAYPQGRVFYKSSTNPRKRKTRAPFLFSTGIGKYLPQVHHHL